MRFDKVIKLINITVTQDDYGDSVETKTETEVYANKKSVGSSEFYAALTNGKDVSVVFEIRVEDYENQKEISFESCEYDVIRTTQKGEGFINLICSNKAV